VFVRAFWQARQFLHHLLRQFAKVRMCHALELKLGKRSYGFSLVIGSASRVLVREASAP
jgi:hypothetical protein